jgi:caspase domain-containing protein
MFLLEISNVKFSFSILTLLLTVVSLQGVSHAEMRFAIAISNFDDTTIPKTPSAANWGHRHRGGHVRRGSKLMRWLGAIFVCLLMLPLLISGANAEKRVALVIGNGAYKNAPKLPNPPNDASDVAASLARLGFDVIVETNLDQIGMQDAAIRFAREARTADVALFYYSGHAVQYNGVNYLAPVDAILSDESDLRRMTRVNEIVSDLEQAKSLRIMVLDSCRDNPLAEQLRRSIGTTRSIQLGRGLARIDTPMGMIMAYATQAGHTAEDGVGSNSPYTAALLKHIEEQNEIGTIFREISEDVYEATKQSQLPELSLSIIGRFYLRGMAVAPTSAATASPDPPLAIKTTSADFEDAVEVDTVASWDAFLKKHPEGFYADMARDRKANIEKSKRLDSATKEIASLPPPVENSGQSQPVPDLARALQIELRRVGCDTSAVEGGWTGRAQEAMERFNGHTGMRLDTKAASADALEVVKSKTRRVCPLDCNHGYRPEGEMCVKIVCDPGSHLSSKNECERDLRENKRRVVLPRTAPSRTVSPTADGAVGTTQRAEQAKNNGNYKMCMGALPGCYERSLGMMGAAQARAWCSRRPTC